MSDFDAVLRETFAGLRERFEAQSEIRPVADQGSTPFPSVVREAFDGLRERFEAMSRLAESPEEGLPR